MKLEENAEQEEENGKNQEGAPEKSPKQTIELDMPYLLALRRLRESPLRLFLKDK